MHLKQRLFVVQATFNGKKHVVGIEIAPGNGGSLGGGRDTWSALYLNKAIVEYEDGRPIPRQRSRPWFNPVKIGSWKQMFVCEGFENGEMKLFDSNVETLSIRLRKPAGYLGCAIFRIYGY